tara:strand:+ start:673 stop:858 length:186 start_codon:yes stop_codon:yes gene_type:complete
LEIWDVPENMKGNKMTKQEAEFIKTKLEIMLTMYVAGRQEIAEQSFRDIILKLNAAIDGEE